MQVIFFIIMPLLQYVNPPLSGGGGYRILYEPKMTARAEKGGGGVVIMGVLGQDSAQFAFGASRHLLSVLCLVFRYFSAMDIDLDSFTSASLRAQ